MSWKPKSIKDVFSVFKTPDKPHLQLSNDFYLVVLAAQAPLPAPNQVASPIHEQGQVKAKIAPLDGEANKDRLHEPMEPGRYVVASTDQKSVLLLTVVPKEQAGFDPDACLDAPLMHDADLEVKARIRSTWTIINITIKSFDPTVWPTVQLIHATAQRLAELTEGVIGDPAALTYRLPSEYEAANEKHPYHVTEQVALYHLPVKTGFDVQTKGLSKFSMPDIVLRELNQSTLKAADAFLFALAKALLDGMTLELGEVYGDGPAQFRAIVRPEVDAKVMELSPEDGQDPNETLEAWWKLKTEL